MKKRILIIGQCTLHMGRMEHGNIGNYYIIEPLIRNLHKSFPNSNIFTTFQMTDKFCKKEKINCLPIDLYYSWSEEDLNIAYKELSIASIFNETHQIIGSTPYIEEVLKSDLVIDFSGDMWSDNTDLAGENRLIIGLIKDRVAQLLGKKTAMLAGSPGPFSNTKIKEFAKQVYKNFDLVTNREPLSTSLLKIDGFDVSKTKNFTCPSFLFEAAKKKQISEILNKEKLINNGIPKIGFIICGWNFVQGPFNKPQRDDIEFQPFIELIEYISRNNNVEIYLMSHANGFSLLDGKIKLQHGRDYPIAKQLQKILIKRNNSKNVFSLDGIYSPQETKSIIGNFDVLVSGRVHGAIAALSQSIPTVILDYGHEPKAHKLKGFAKLLNIEKYIVDPSKKDELIKVFNNCWKNRKIIKTKLQRKIPKIKELAIKNFTILKEI